MIVFASPKAVTLGVCRPFPSRTRPTAIVHRWARSFQDLRDGEEKALPPLSAEETTAEKLAGRRGVELPTRIHDRDFVHSAASQIQMPVRCRDHVPHYATA